MQSLYKNLHLSQQQGKRHRGLEEKSKFLLEKGYPMQGIKDGIKKQSLDIETLKMPSNNQLQGDLDVLTFLYTHSLNNPIIQKDIDNSLLSASNRMKTVMQHKP